MLYIYKAKDQSGVLRKGEIEAENSEKAYSVLREEGLFLLSIQEKKSSKKSISFGLKLFSGVSTKSLAIFTRELQVMVKAGLSLVAALKAQAEQSEDKTLKKIAEKLAQKVEGGTPLSEAMSQFPSVFSPFYTNTIKSGEKSGGLDEVLSSLTIQLEKDYELQSKIKGAMIYPAFILLALIGVMVIILIYVIPSLTKLFNEIGGTLPITTRALIVSSKFMRSYWWTLILGIFLFYYFLRLFRKTKNGPYILDRIKMKIPILGLILRKIYIARFCRTGSTLIKAGLPIIDVLETTKTVVNNAMYQAEIEQVRKKVENGLPLSKALKEAPRFPPMLNQLVAVGENTGNLEESLDTLANFYEKEITATTEALASLIEPVLIVIMGLAVGLVVVSVIKPIYDLSNIL